MKGLYRKLAPFTPDSAGAAAVFADLPALIIPLDMNGTVSTFRNRVGVQPESGVRVCSALGSREMGYVLGDLEDFARECLGLMERFEHEFTVLLHGPVSAMTGVDVRALAQLLEERTGTPVVAVDCSGNGTYEKGLAAALAVAFERVRGACGSARGDDAHGRPPVREGTCNLLGINSVDHNDPALRELLARRACDAVGMDAVGIWGCRDGWREWERAGEAQLNIVCSTSALGLARSMQAAWGTPYRFIDEVLASAGGGSDGVDDGGARTAGVGGGNNSGARRVLVMGEQLLANIARAEVERIGHAASVGTFFKLLRERAREDDVRVESERAFEELLRSGAYDAVLADPALAPCVPEGVRLVEFEHSAVAQVVALRKRTRTLLTPEWLTYVQRELAE